MRRLNIICVIWFALFGVTVLLTSATGLLAADGYIFDIAKQNPKAIRLWSSIVPPTYSHEPWIKQLNGTTIPVTRIVYGGKPFYLGGVCRPHDCGGNWVVFLLALNGSETYGLLRSKTLKVNDEAFGFPRNDALEIMRRYMDAL